MAVIVTGATSFIGKAAVEECLRQGHKVYAVARPGSAGIERLRAIKAGNGAEDPAGAGDGKLKLLECSLQEIETLQSRRLRLAASGMGGSGERQPPGSRPSGKKYRLCHFSP